MEIMDAQRGLVVERLWEQMLYWNPKLSDNIEQKLLITNKLQEQLLDGRAVVRVKTLEVEYDELHKSCENKIIELKHILEKANENNRPMDEELNSDSEFKGEDIKMESLFESDSSDNEQLSVLAKKCKHGETSNEMQLPLALRKTPRKRTKSSNFKYAETSPLKTSKQVRAKGRGKRSIIYCCEEDAECNRESHHSLHIEIPRLLLQGRRHHIYLGNKLSEETFADMAREAKQRALEKYPKCSTQTTKQKQKKRDIAMMFASSSVPDSQQTPEEVEFCQLVRDIMPGDESEDEETWQAARALECINNNVLDNLDTAEGILSFPQSAQEAPICCEPTTSKKRRKSPKPNNKVPPAKRGRKPKNIKDSLLVQPPTKSNLAQYVENFSNGCVMPGSATPAASSTMSQPLVSSTTHNFEFIDQQDPGTVMCYIEGDWANGGSCQLVTRNGFYINDSQIQAENMNEITLPFQENTSDGNRALPISVPLTTFEFSNLTQCRSMQHTAELQNAFAHPIINIQIPTLPVATPTVITSAECNGVQPPPPAHIISNCILDLSIKSKMSDTANSSIDVTNFSINTNTPFKCPEVIDDGNATVPLDLSLKVESNQSITSTNVTTELDTPLSDSNYVVEHNGQYYDFARCLDELEIVRPDKPYKGKDMPLLDYNNEQEDVLMKVSSAATKSLSIDSNYVTMNEDNSEMHSCTLGQEFQFANESTKEIFDNLFEIGSFTAGDDEKMGIINVSCPALDNESFNSNKFQNSTLINATRDKINNKDTINEQGLNFDSVIKDDIVSYVNITDTCSNTSPTVDQMKSDESKVLEICEPMINEETHDSLQHNLDDVTNDIGISVQNCATTSSPVKETTTTTSGTPKVAEKFVPRILKRFHKTVNKLIPTKDIEQFKESNAKSHEEEKSKNLEKTSEKPNGKNQLECVNDSKSISDTKPPISKGNTSVTNDDVAEDDAITIANILNQRQQSELHYVSEDTEVVVRDGKCCENVSISVTGITNVVDTSVQHSKQGVEESEEKLYNTIRTFKSFESTNSESLELQTKSVSAIAETSFVEKSSDLATEITCSSKQLNETYALQKDTDKQVIINPSELPVYTSSKECEIPNFDTDSNVSIEKIVFSVKRVALSGERNSLDYTFESCERRAAQAGVSLNIEDNKNCQLFDSSYNTIENTKNSTIENNLEDPGKHCTTNIINNAKEPLAKTSNGDLTNVPHKSSKVSPSQCIGPEREKQRDIDAILNLTMNSEKQVEKNESSHEDVCYLEDVKSNNEEVSSSLTPQADVTENPSQCQVVDKISLHKSQLLNTSNQIQTIKLLETSTGNDVRHESQYEENIEDHNTNDENNYNTVVIPKNTTLDLSSMSLLEMESKLEADNLDFEEDFDDALSLATSSFDSPNDSRFMESLVYESDSSANDHDVSTPANTIIDTNIVPKHDTIPSLQDLKNFKIPKLKKLPSAELNKHEGTTNMSIMCKDIAHINHFTLQPSVRLEKISINKESKIERTEDGNVAVNSKVLNSITMDVGNITKSIKKENANAANIAEILSHNQQHSHSQQKMLQSVKFIITNNSPHTINQQPPLSTNVGNVNSNENKKYIYGITCLPYLVDRCLKSATHCQYSHQFEDNDAVFKCLSTLKTFQLIECYSFMYNHQKLYKLYFPAFCNLYTLRKDRNKLLSMAIDCERYPQYSEYVIGVYESLVKCGLSRINACRHILQRCKERSTDFIDALVAIIMKSDWTMFTDYVERFAQGDYHFRFRTLEHMSQAVLHSNNEHLKYVFGKCVAMLHPDDNALLFTSPDVIQWANLFINP